MVELGEPDYNSSNWLRNMTTTVLVAVVEVWETGYATSNNDAGMLSAAHCG